MTSYTLGWLLVFPTQAWNKKVYSNLSKRSLLYLPMHLNQPTSPAKVVQEKTPRFLKENNFAKQKYFFVITEK